MAQTQLALARPPSSAFPAGDPNLVVRRILAQPAFAAPSTTSTPPKPSLLQRAWSWAVEQVRKIFDPIRKALRGTSRAATALGVAIITAAIAVLAIALARIITFALLRHTPAPRRPAGEAIEFEQTAAEWRALAESFAKAGAYDAAIAALWIGALRLLDERGSVRFDPARAPGEYRRIVRVTRAALANAFEMLATRYVRASFSREGVDRGDYEAASHAYVSLEAATG